MRETTASETKSSAAPTTATRKAESAFAAANDRMSAAAASAWSDPAYRAEMQRRMREGWALRRKRLSEGTTR
jgi:hypothetical protein